MPALFDNGFFVRKPAWHGLGVVLDEYPGREEAMRLADHDWDIVTLDDLRVAIPNEVLVAAGQQPNDQGIGVLRKLTGHKALFRSDNLGLLNVARESYTEISNYTAYDIAELLFDQGFKYEAGIMVDGGKTCALTLLLDEPVTITGDDSVVLPFGLLRWSHDGSGSLSVNTGTIRQVCMNTVNMAEAEGKKLGTSFVFRHTKNVHARIEDAKQAVMNARQAVDVYRRVAEELAAIPVTPAQRDWFVSTIVGDRDGRISNGRDATVSARVINNVETERAKVNSLFFGQTIPEAHRLTAYGLWLSGGEYFDHLRNYRSEDSYVKRTLLNTSVEKQNLRKTISEALAVA